jgi:4-hydroxy-tetrahydrodipicolinate synthase
MTQPGPAFLRGIVPSMNTPFLDDGSVDLAGIRRSVDAVLQAGAAGMLILAVAAETASLTLTEKRLVAQTFLAQTAGRIPVIIGCSSAEQTDRVALAAMAREFGAQIMLCQAPAGLAGEALVAQMAALAQVGPPMLMVQDLDFGGPGLALDDILLLREQLPAFQCLKIEVTLPGPKYSAVLEATQGALHVSGGWAAAQMMEALHRGVHAFIPTGDVAGARALHEQLAPVLAFSNQHLDTSIRFFKHLRHREGLFATPLCRSSVRPLDAHQMRELELNVERVLAMQGQLRA